MLEICALTANVWSIQHFDLQNQALWPIPISLCDIMALMMRTITDGFIDNSHINIEGIHSHEDESKIDLVVLPNGSHDNRSQYILFLKPGNGSIAKQYRR